MEATPVAKTIFVVEDDDDIARLISHNLEVAGFLVRLSCPNQSNGPLRCSFWI